MTLENFYKEINEYQNSKNYYDVDTIEVLKMKDINEKSLSRFRSFLDLGVVDALNVVGGDFMYFDDLQLFEYKEWLLKYGSVRERVNMLNNRIDTHTYDVNEEKYSFLVAMTYPGTRDFRKLICDNDYDIASKFWSEYAELGFVYNCGTFLNIPNRVDYRLNNYYQWFKVVSNFEYGLYHLSIIHTANLNAGVLDKYY